MDDNSKHLRGITDTVDFARLQLFHLAFIGSYVHSPFLYDERHARRTTEKLLAQVIAHIASFFNEQQIDPTELQVAWAP